MHKLSYSHHKWCKTIIDFESMIYQKHISQVILSLVTDCNRIKGYCVCVFTIVNQK